jgi:hypothetical protein
VVFHPQEPSLGSSGLTQVALPYLSGAPKAAIKTGASLPFKKILSHCPAEILSEMNRAPSPAQGKSKWPGKLYAEILSVAF